MKLGDPAARVAVETVPTGSLSLDIALGLGGVPRAVSYTHLDVYKRQGIFIVEFRGAVQWEVRL